MNPSERPNPLRSMTGYGRCSLERDGVAVTVEVTSVNRRGLEVSASLPREWQLLERAVVDRLRALAVRGRIHASIQIQLTAMEGGGWDPVAVREQMQALETLARSLGIAFQPDAHLLLRVVLESRPAADSSRTDKVEPVLFEALESAAAALTEMRDREGRSLGQDLLRRLETLCTAVQAITLESRSVVPDYREALLNRLRQAGLVFDPADERVLKEVTLFADRCDISEELTRLSSHLGQLGISLTQAPSPEAVGRKLDFLLQEILREFNTLGVKSNRLEISRAVMEAKNEIERMREQVQNVE